MPATSSSSGGGPSAPRLAALLALVAATTAPLALAGSSFTVDLCSRLGGYFDTAALACTACGTSTENVAPDNRTLDVLGNAAVCTCRFGFQSGPSATPCDPTSLSTCPANVCSACPAGQATARGNGARCLPCDASTLGLGADGLDCACFPAAQGSGVLALTEAGPGGAPLAAKGCAACPNRTRVFAAPTGPRAASLYRCQACSDPSASMGTDGLCACDAGFVAGGVPALAPDGGVSCLDAGQLASLTAQSAYAESGATVAVFSSLQLAVGGPSTASTTRSSLWYKHLYLPSAVACAHLRPATSGSAACQTLANLCVLALYSPAASPCALYAAIAAARRASDYGFAGWPATLPFLLYSSPEKAVLADTTLARTMSFDASKEAGTSDSMTFVLASYALNGSFLGLQRLTNQLLYCGLGGGGGASSSDDPSWLKFGYGTRTSVSCNLRTLAAAGAPVFYDLFVRDLEADQASIAAELAALSSSASASISGSGVAQPLPATLYPVPVRLVNYRDSAQQVGGGGQPNLNRAFADESDDVLTRRFALFDAVSGVTTAGAAPEVLRYAFDVRLRVTTRLSGANQRPNLMAPPTLTITYRERLTASMLSSAGGGGGGSSSAAGSGLSSDTVTFSVEYLNPANTDFGTTVLAIAVSYGVLVVMWAVSRVVSWTRLNARTELEAAVGAPMALQLLLALVQSFARGYFWFLWAVCLYWLCFFKLQTAVYCILPLVRPDYSDNAYVAFQGALVAVFVAYLARVLLLVRAQVTADLFVVDWEGPRGALVRVGGEHEAALQAANARTAPSRAYGGAAEAQAAPGGAASGPRFAPVSVWRTIHAANEWAELATNRRVPLAFTLLVLVAVLQGGGLQYVATPQPSRWDLSPGAINPLLQFANSVFWFWVIVLCQLLYVVAVGERYVGENPCTRFIDVCTVAKVSLLLMDARYHGFYIHACAPHEHADGDMAELAGHLAEEAGAMRSGRGLPGCPDPTVQSFELHVPALWREQYDRVYRRLLAQETDAVEALARDVTTQQHGGGGGARLVYGGGYGLGAAATAPSSSASSSAGAAAWQQPGARPLPGASGPLVTLSSVSSVEKLKEKTRRLHGAFLQLNAFLRAFVDETDPDFKRAWRERSLVQSMFDMPPDVLSETLLARSQGTGAVSRTALVVPDGGYRFESLLFRGIETDLLTLDILLYCLVDYTTDNPVLSAIAAFIVDQAIAWARRVLGRRNMTFKTLIDERFLK